MTRGLGILPRRLVVGIALLALAAGIFIARPGTALAHHVNLSSNVTCNSYVIEADYIGGEGERYAEVRVNGSLVSTVTFLADGGDVDNFYVNAGPLPANVTVEVSLFAPQPGQDWEIDWDTVTVNAGATCATWTPTSTATAPATNTPTSTGTPISTETPTTTPTPSDTETAVPTNTPGTTATPTETATSVASVTSTATPTATSAEATSTPEASTKTPVPTATTEAVATPTFVSTVLALLPPGQPETSENPPSQTASGLPNAGTAGDGVRGFLFGLLSLAIAGAGLGVIGSGLREQRAN